MLTANRRDFLEEEDLQSRGLCLRLTSSGTEPAET